ncbi:hypothetical protein OHV61_14795 [Acinetobacter baumannii]|nr:hypothetical protein [Acinetobacter baumannii]
MSEFKAGDQIVAKDESIKKVFTILGVEYGDLFKVAERSFFEIGSFRHATPEEIAAGHRIDNDMGDDFPIENRISPYCQSRDV